MTKDEALKIARSRGFTSSANDWIGLFEDLGMLKLDEPETIEDRARKALSNLFVCESFPGPKINLGNSAGQILGALRRAGIDIVEK